MKAIERKTRYRIFFGLVCLLLLSCYSLAQQLSLTILHTNDTHGHLLPFSYPSIAPRGSTIAAIRYRKNIGGIARRATLVKRLRANLEKKGTSVWLVDAGDFLDGTPFSTEYRGEADIAAMNAAGYTFGTLGNHELNISLANLKDLIGMSQFPLICSNLTENITGQPLARISEIRNVGPVRVGIFGLLTREASRYPAAKDNLTIADEIQTASRMAGALRRQADIVLLLSHAGEKMDEKIAAAVPDINLIIGGHSHTRLPLGELISPPAEQKANERPGTIIVQAYQWGGELGRLDLTFTQDTQGGWRIERYRARLIPITSNIPEDAAVASVVARYWKPIAAKYGEMIGRASADFAESGDDLAQYNFVADTVREAYGTEIALENTGGLRAPLIKGNITLGDLVDLDPFDNTVVTFKITGRQLKEILLKYLPAVSGLRYRVQNGQLLAVSVGSRALVDDRLYTGTTNSYFAGVALKGIETVDTGKIRRDVIIEQIRKKRTVHPVYDGRRIIVNLPYGTKRNS